MRKAPTKYVPPNMRGGSATGDTDRRGPSGGRMGRSGKNAPDLNAMNFPSLSDSTGIKDGSKSVPRNRLVNFTCLNNVNLV